MKIFKKTVSALLAVILAFSCVVFAGAQQEKTPVIIVTGMNTLPLYLDKGTENEQQVFPFTSDTIVSAVFGALPALMLVPVTGNWDTLNDKLVEGVNNMLGVLALNPDGTSKYNVTCASFDKPYSYYVENYDEEFFEAAKDLGEAAAAELGGDNVYVYVYDWRKATVTNAEGLDTLVNKVLDDTDSEKVTLAAISQGGTVTMTYLEMFGTESVSNVVMLSSAFRGINMVGDLFSGRVSFDLGSMMSFLTNNTSYAGSDALNLLFGGLIFKGLCAVTDPLLDIVLKNTDDRLFEESLATTFGTFGGTFGILPYDDYMAARAFMHGDAVTPELDRVDYYFKNVSGKCEEILNGVMADGVPVHVLSLYGKRSLPFGDDDAVQSDGVIETVRTSAGATCALLNETLGDSYVQKNTACGHNHLSADGVVDASTCMLPEQTWFIRDMAHTEFNENCAEGIDFIMWLVTADTQLYVTDSDGYAQFMLLDRETRKLSAIDGEISKYSFVNNFNAFIADVREMFN